MKGERYELVFICPELAGFHKAFMMAMREECGSLSRIFRDGDRRKEGYSDLTFAYCGLPG
jgi:hypothetical protein